MRRAALLILAAGIFCAGTAKLLTFEYTEAQVIQVPDIQSFSERLRSLPNPLNSCIRSYSR